MPAQRLILAEVVGDEESLVARVNAYLDGAQTTAPLVGPALAGVLIAALGPTNVLYVDAATFAVAAIAVGLFVPQRKPITEAEERELLAGVKYILRSRLLVFLGITMLTMEFFFALFVTTLPAFAYSDYDHNARIAGVFYAAMGAGALIGIPVVSRVVRRSARSTSPQQDSCSRRSRNCSSGTTPRRRSRRRASPTRVLRTADRRTDLHRHHDPHTRNLRIKVLSAAVGDVPHGAVRPDRSRSTDQRGRGKNGLHHRRHRIPARVRAVRHPRSSAPEDGRSRLACVRRRTL